MIRMLIRLAVSLGTAAVAIAIAAGILDGFHITWTGFLLAVGVFTVAQAILAPFILSVARKYANALLGGIGIVSTLVALIIASFVPGGIQISGIQTWILAALVVWVVTALGGWILLAFVLKKWTSKDT